MVSRQIVTHGVVLPNVSLQLDPLVELPVGPVEVLVRARPVGKPSPDKPSNWVEYLLAARDALEKQGFPLMTPAKAEAHITDLREDRKSSGQTSSLEEIREGLSRYAKANGLTEEILADLLKDE
jgi:hypothetical protein